ncbi:hypothetical protein A3Q56_07828 [Intoshia linei]|uniref:Uncharacterized protein n=1 Tax=Intoshia linei TaxID=1819745 RepID=A0A177AT96_9BILA|nr:hypothetical protein A3Q56_07828 [Intoshia linei]
MNSESILEYLELEMSCDEKWVEWIVIKYLPLNFCKKKLVRQNTKLKPICVNTLKSEMSTLIKNVEQSILNILPESFGLVGDGWCYGGTHFVSCFAVFDSYLSPILFLFSPLTDEENLSVCSNIEFLSEAVEKYNKTYKNIIFLVGDNCSTNKSIAKKMLKHFLGCSSHRFNLAMNLFLQNKKAGRDDYLKYKLSEYYKFLNRKGIEPFIRYKCPGHMSAARWNSKALYCLTVSF